MTEFNQETKEIITELNRVLASEQLPEVGRVNLLDVVEDTSSYAGDTFYVIAAESDKVFAAYKVVVKNGTTELVEAWKGTPYVALKPIMMRVVRDDYARNQVTKIMGQSYSPLDILITQKGVTSDELLPTISNLDANELRELHDFVDGMKMALNTMQTISPSSAQEFYPTGLGASYDDYDEAEDEAFLEDDVYDEDYDEDGEFKYPDEAKEAEADYGEEASEIEDGSPGNYIGRNVITSIPERKDAGLAAKLLGIFKRK